MYIWEMCHEPSKNFPDITSIKELVGWLTKVRRVLSTSFHWKCDTDNYMFYCNTLISVSIINLK